MNRIHFKLRVEGEVPIKMYIEECEKFLKLGYDGAVTSLGDSVYFEFEKEVEAKRVTKE